MRRFRRVQGRLLMLLWVPMLALLIALGPKLALASGPTKRAARLARKALKAYRDGELLRAGDLFFKAYKLSKRAVQLRNAAKSFEEGGDLHRAKELWERYRDLPSISSDERREAAAHVALVRERQQKLEISREVEEARRAAEIAESNAEAARKAAELARKRPRRGPPGPRVSAKPPGSSSSKVEVETTAPAVGPYLVIGAGGASGIVSLVLWLVAKEKLKTYDELEMMRNDEGKIDKFTMAEGNAMVAEINRMRVASGVMLGLGITAIASGTLWALLGGGDEPQSEPKLSFWLGDRDGAGLTLSGRF